MVFTMPKWAAFLRFQNGVSGALGPLTQFALRGRVRAQDAQRLPRRERVHDFQQLDKASSAVAATIIQRLCSRHCV